MRAKGIAYDVGMVGKGGLSRERLEPEVVRRELTIIRDDLHCNAVQIIGAEPDRLELAASCAANLGLEVWFSPYPLEQTPDEILSLFDDCAERAERIRDGGANVVFVGGVELTIMNRGFMGGDTPDERLAVLLGQPDRRARIAEISTRLNEFLSRAIATIRGTFCGKVTYASIPFERIDWTPLDFVAVELIRSSEVADQFRDGVRALVAGGKPVAITGFGTATYRGAGARGGRTMEIVESDKDSGAPLRLNGEYVRDEAGQAQYVKELLDIFDSEGVDAAFVYLFALYNFPHRPDGDPCNDLDLASPGIVKVLEGRQGVAYPDMAWEPKFAFATVAECYRRY